MAWRRGQAYGQDLRERVLGAAGLSLRAAAARFAVSPSYVAKVRARLRDTGEATPGPQRNHVPPRLAPLADESMQTCGVWSGSGRIPAHGGGGGRCRSWCGG